MRCFCDGCGRQNRNYVFMSMLGFWFLTVTPIQITVWKLFSQWLGTNSCPLIGCLENWRRMYERRIFSQDGITISLASKVFLLRKKNGDLEVKGEVNYLNNTGTSKKPFFSCFLLKKFISTFLFFLVLFSY